MFDKKFAMGRKAGKSLREKNGIMVVEDRGLKLQWINFIKEFVANGGNGAQAYMKVYNTDNKLVASACATRLLKNENIRDELNYQLDAQKITENSLYMGIMGIAQQANDPKTVLAAVKAYELLCKMKGLLIDTKKFEFTVDNPAYVPPVVDIESHKRLQDAKKGVFVEGMGRVIE